MGSRVKKLAVGALTLIMLFGVLTIAQAQESDGAVAPSLDSARTRVLRLR